MSTTALCPSCRSQLHIPSVAPAAQVRCPACKTVFAAAEAVAPPSAQPTTPAHPAPEESVRAGEPAPSATAVSRPTPAPRPPSKSAGPSARRPKSAVLAWILVGGLGLGLGVTCLLGVVSTAAWLLLRADADEADPAHPEVPLARADDAPVREPMNIDVVPPPGNQPPAQNLPTLPLENGVGQFKGRLDRWGVVDAKAGGPGQVVLVRLEAKQSYVIEHCRLAGAKFDPLLRVETSEGEVLGEDDDAGGNLNARLVIAPLRTADYRLIAMSRAGTEGDFVLSVREAARPALPRDDLFPRREATGIAHAVADSAQVDKIKVTTCSGLGKLCGDVVWHIDGKQFFTLSEEGVLRRIALPGFVEDVRLDLKRSCRQLVRSKEGLLVSIAERDLSELWIIDPESLTVKAAVKFEAPFQMAASPGSSLALTRDVKGLNLWDVSANKKVDQLDLGKGPLPQMTSDGKYCFGNEGGALVRYQVANGALVREQASRAFAMDARAAVGVSPDDQWVYLAGRHKRDAFPGPEAFGEVTYLFKASDLTRPAATLGSADMIGFNPKRSEILAFNRMNQMAVHPVGGVALNYYNLRPGFMSPNQALALPDGERILARYGNSLWLLELTKAAVVAKERPATKTPQPLGALTLHPLDVDGFIVHHLTHDGKYLFVAEIKTRLLRRIRVKDRVEEAQAELSGAPAGLDMTTEGLVCSLNHAVVVIDPQTLKEVRQFPTLPTGAIRAVAGGPYVMNLGWDCTILDVKTGDRGKPLNIRKPAQDRLFKTAGQTVSPDGAAFYVITEDGPNSRHLQRYVRNGLEWQPEAKTTFSSIRECIIVASPDGKTVAVFSFSLPGAEADLPLTIYDARKLERMHAFKLAQSVSSLVYSSSGQEVIIGTGPNWAIQVHSLNGKQLKTHHWGESPPVLASLRGGVLVVYSGLGVLIVEFPDKEK